MIWTRTTAAGRMAGDAPTRRRFTVLLLIASLLASLGVVAPVSVTPALAVA
ncbi:MAG: hypothetical protein RL338_1364, partial [Chloroflexota bacterium]